VFGTEISKTAIKIANEKYDLDIFQGQLEDLPLDRTFSNISLFHILEHVPNPLTFLQRCHDLLEQGGTLTIAVPNDLLSWELKIRTALKRLRKRLPRGTGRYGLPKIVLDGSVDEIHLSQFTPKSLQTILRKIGFDVILNTVDPYYVKAGWKIWLHHFHYAFHLTLNRLFGINRYNTILMVARKI
jgi:SAM-dependent methyltransferase